VHIFASVKVFTGGRHHSCPVTDTHTWAHGQNERRTHGQNDQSHNLLQCSLRSIGGDNYFSRNYTLSRTWHLR